MPRHSASSIDVRGDAPDAFDGSTPPSAIFIGGGLTQPGLLDACLDHLPPGGRLVVNAVTAESEAALAQSHSRLGGDLRRFQHYQGEPLGGFTGWRPQMPVTQWAVTKVTVYFIGAGPGAADLITVRGQRLLETMPGLPVRRFDHARRPAWRCARPEAKVVDTGPLTLEQIVTELADADAAGHDVARLHSGDPSLYSALAEQCRRLDALGIDYEIVPGVPAFAAAAAALKTRAHRARRRADRDADPGGHAVDAHAARRRPGHPRPIRCAPWSCTWPPPRSTPSSRNCLRAAIGPKHPLPSWLSPAGRSRLVLRGTLADIAGQMHDADITKTAVIVVGDVLAAEGFTDSYLYSAGRTRGSRH